VATPKETMRAADVLAFHRTLSNWGRWGPEDERGTLNLVTPEVTAAAAATVSSGRTVSCARPLNTRASSDNPRPATHVMLGTHADGMGSDSLAVAPHGFATTHVDALCHVFYEGRLYNGYDSATVTSDGATRLGIHHLRSGIVTRGVLLDIAAGRARGALEPGEPVYPEDLDAAESAAGLRVRAGDALLVRTGRWLWRDQHGPWDAARLLAGLHASCLPWLRERDVAILGGDGVSDVLPSLVEGVPLPVHSVGIVAMGLHLIDNLDLEPLAAACGSEHRSHFLFVVAPLVVERGTASPVNPLALF
jgi:kynurenine formamidase